MIMLSAAALVSVTFGVRQVFGLFLVPISAALDGGIQIFSLAIAVQNLIWGLSSPFFGAVADRFGAWRVAAFGVLIYTAGLLSMAFVVTETGVFFGQVLIGMGLGSAGISIAVGAVARAAPPEKRSLAMGLVTSFGSFGQFALVPVAQIMMNEHGWQFAIVILSAIVASMVAVTLGMRVPAGGTRPLEGITQTAGSALRQATGSRDYILLTIGFFVCGLQLVFITTHLPTYLQDAGLSAEIASWSLALIGLFNIIGAFMCGWLGGIVSKKKTLAIVYLLRGLIIAAFISLPAVKEENPSDCLSASRADHRCFYQPASKSGNGAVFRGGNGAFMAWHYSADKRVDSCLFRAASFKHALWSGVSITSDRVICRRMAWRHLV